MNRKCIQRIAGVDIGGTKTAVVTWDPESGLSEHMRFPTKDPVETLDNVVECLRGLETLDAIGIACGNPLDSQRGIILSPPNLPEWDRVRIVDLLKARFKCSVHLLNDANANALAEWTFGAGNRVNSLVFLTAGTGMGAGIVINGDLYEGACGNAGEVGHIRLSKKGPIGYHKAGSFEGFCSGGCIPELVDFIPEHLSARDLICWKQKHVTTEAIAMAAKRGDCVARQVFAEMGRRMGQTLAILIDSLNPEKIVIGSLFVRCRDLFEDEMMRVLRQEALSDSVAACRIEPSTLGESIGSYGAICSALHGIKRLKDAYPIHPQIKL